MQKLVDNFHFSEIWDVNGFPFKECSVEIRCVVFRRRKRKSASRKTENIIERFRRRTILSGVQLVRGRLSMCDARASKSVQAVPLIHTTNLKDNKGAAAHSLHVKTNFEIRNSAVLTLSSRKTG